MYALQAGFERFANNAFDNLIIHYHKYDRKYDEQGTVNKYYSESITTKAERDLIFNEKIYLHIYTFYKYFIFSRNSKN